jgi:hypothetical protein
MRTETGDPVRLDPLAEITGGDLSTASLVTLRRTSDAVGNSVWRERRAK